MRSSLHPALFATIYRLAAGLAERCALTTSDRANLLLAAPKLTQALFAALLDCYTWKLAEKAYGRASRTAFTTVRNLIAQTIEKRKKKLLVISDILRVTIACIVRMQSLAMVLLNPNPVQLSGDGCHNCRRLLLALARAGVPRMWKLSPSG